MPSIGARFYTQLDSAYLWGDMVEGELEKESIFFVNFFVNIFCQHFLSTIFVDISVNIFGQHFVDICFGHFCWYFFVDILRRHFLLTFC